MLAVTNDSERAAVRVQYEDYICSKLGHIWMSVLFYEVPNITSKAAPIARALRPPAL